METLPEKSAMEGKRRPPMIRGMPFEKKTELAAPPPPDGGWHAWLQVAMAHVMYANTV